MALMPGAVWIGPTPNRRVGGMYDHRGLVLHIQEGYEDGSESWFKNPESQASAHFLNPKSGQLRQLVDTDDRAWAEAAGNSSWVSVENEGFGGDSLTASQIENCAQLYAWLHQTYGVPLQSTDDPAGSGLGWHGMGGAAWGGHYDCPGEPIKAQRGQILARAQQILNPEPPAPPEDIVTPQDIQAIAAAVWGYSVPVPHLNDDGTVTNPTQQAAVWPLVWGNVWSARQLKAIAAMQGALTALITQLGTAHPGVDTATVVAAVEQAIANAVVHVDVNVTAPSPSA